jgi:hypothetical protein
LVLGDRDCCCPHRLGGGRLNEWTYDRQSPDDVLQDCPETYRDAVVSLLVFAVAIALLVGLGAALFLFWLAFDGDVQEWRLRFDFRHAVDKVQVAIAEDLARTHKWNEECRRH